MMADGFRAHPIRNDDDDDAPEKEAAPAGEDFVGKALFESRTILITGGINDKVARSVCAQLFALAAKSDDPIVMVISSPGGHGNYLKKSIQDAGLDPDNLPESDPSKMNFGSGSNSSAKAWKDIWGSGQGIGAVDAVRSTADYVDLLKVQYEAAKRRVC